MTDNRVSVIRQLLHDVAGEGERAKRYKNDGYKDENALTAEVLQGLDFLPRRHFLGEIIQQSHSISDSANIAEIKSALAEQSEDMELVFQPEGLPFRGDSRHQTEFVNPDGLFETKDVAYILIEAKLKQGSFGSEQLAREYVVLMREARDRTPLLLLILGRGPLVRVEGHKDPQRIKESIEGGLKSVRSKVECQYSFSELVDRVDRTVAWITWKEITEIVCRQLDCFAAESSSTRAAVKRVADSIVKAIEFDGQFV